MKVILKKFVGIFLLLIAIGKTHAQNTVSLNKVSTFERIAAEVKQYKVDTSAVPDDKTTQLIVKLRELRGGFNINEAIEFKLQEEMQKKEKPMAELQKAVDYFKTGVGKTKLDNAIIWIYRNTFTYQELKDLVKFYQSTAGQKNFLLSCLNHWQQPK